MSPRAAFVLGALWAWPLGMATCRLLDALEVHSHTVVRRRATPPAAVLSRKEPPPMTDSTTTANPIVELLRALPPKLRLVIYAVLAVLAVVYGAYQASDGDWGQTIAALFVLLVGSTASANVDTKS